MPSYTGPATRAPIPVPPIPMSQPRTVMLPVAATSKASPKAGLTPAFIVPNVRTIFPIDAVSPARPSVNLGHALNSSAIQAGAHLLPQVQLSNPIPFHIMNPQRNNPTATTSASYGSRVSDAIKALQRPSFSEPGGPKPTVNFGHRVVQAIRAVTK